MTTKREKYYQYCKICDYLDEQKRPCTAKEICEALGLTSKEFRILRIFGCANKDNWRFIKGMKVIYAREWRDANYYSTSPMADDFTLDGSRTTEQIAEEIVSFLKKNVGKEVSSEDIKVAVHITPQEKYLYGKAIQRIKIRTDLIKSSKKSKCIKYIL